METTTEVNKRLAGACGLYCEACTLYIATTEDPERLRRLARHFQLEEEAIRCRGCRSEERGPYCTKCKMIACATERNIDFCSQCAEYPCPDLKLFQSARPHRIDLWDDLARIKNVGWQQWLVEARLKYTCPRCQTINSAYDEKCRACSAQPSCEYVNRNGKIIKDFLATS
jgi:phage FluMu protein Com